MMPCHASQECRNFLATHIGISNRIALRWDFLPHLTAFGNIGREQRRFMRHKVVVVGNLRAPTLGACRQDGGASRRPLALPGAADERISPWPHGAGERRCCQRGGCRTRPMPP